MGRVRVPHCSRRGRSCEVFCWRKAKYMVSAIAGCAVADAEMLSAIHRDIQRANHVCSTIFASRVKVRARRACAMDCCVIPTFLHCN